jgi:molybdopterin molybdotransferase
LDVGWEYTALGEALGILSRTLRTRPMRESVGTRQAYGMVLAADVVSGKDRPSRDVSHFDGYAVASIDTAAATAEAPITLRLQQGGRAIPLGVAPAAALRKGHAMNVLTGGYLPSGADAVIPVEDSTREGDGIVVRRPAERWERIYRAGSDVRKGERVLRAGRELRGQDLVLLASLRYPRVAVYRRPRVAVLPTGSELTTDIADRRSGKVVESNSILLEQVIAGAGGEPVMCGIVKDDIDSLSIALKDALRKNDIVFTLAGSSVGEPDLVDSAIRGFGRATTALVHGLRVNRGRVMGVAVVHGRPVVILPGPIQGALNAFIALGYPLIRQHLGRGFERPPSITVRLGADWEAQGKFRDFDQVVYLTLVPGSGSGGDGELLAVPSGDATEKVSFLVSKDAYAYIQGGRSRLAKGELVEAHLLPGFSSPLRP